MACLTELLAELYFATGKSGEYSPPADQSCRNMAQEMMYTHRIGATQPFMRHLQQNQSPCLTARCGVANRQALGTDGCVFLWLGAAAYEQPPFVVFIDPAVEREPSIDMLTAPWDTGGLVNKGVLGIAMSPQDARCCIERYSLEPPEHREYLHAVLEWCFDSPGDYLKGNEHAGYYPGRVSNRPNQQQLPSQTFESRVLHALPLAENIISIVMDPARLGERGEPLDGQRIAGFKRLCQDLEIRLVLAERERRDSLSSLIVREASRILQERGAL